MYENLPGGAYFQGTMKLPSNCMTPQFRCGHQNILYSSGFHTETVEVAVALITQLNQALSEYGFKLGKWAANAANILKDCSLDQINRYEITDNQMNKRLGMWWIAYSDNLRYKFEVNATSAILTKRVVLSSTAKLFDPLGFLLPVIIQAKIFLQKLW